MNTIWKIPACQKKSFEEESRSCMRYHIDKCMAPCIHSINHELYKETVKELIDYFNGKNKKAITRLQKEMNEHARNLNFEKANIVKQQITTLIYLQNKNQRMYHFPSKKDVVLLIRAYHSPIFTLFYIRNKKVIGRIDFSDDLDEEVLSKFIIEMEETRTVVAKEELLQCLSEIVADKVFIVLPTKKSKETTLKKIKKGYLEFIKM